MIKKYTVLVFLILSSLVVRSQNTLVFQASKDTYINTVIADQLQGQVQSIIASAWTYNDIYGKGRSLLGFELCEIPEDFILVSATLNLYHDYSASHAGHTTNGLNSAKLYQITSSWDESTTWSSQPTYDFTSFSNISSSTTATQNYTIDVTGIVNNEISTSNEVDFYLALNEEIVYRSLVFASKDHPDQNIRPTLKLVYYTDSTWCNNPSNSVDNVQSCLEELNIPNVFSPNGDLINDYFKIEAGCQSSTFHIDILNRWGNLVFESNDYGFEWNGKDKNIDVNVADGVYFYRIIVSDEKKDLLKTGFITLTR